MLVRLLDSVIPAWSAGIQADMDVSGRILHTWMPAIHAGIYEALHFHVRKIMNHFVVKTSLLKWCLRMNIFRKFARPAQSSLCQMKKLDGVAADHFVFFRIGHAGEVSLDNAHGFGPVGFLMRKIGAPDQPIDVDFVAQLNPDAIELKTPQAVLANVLAR